MSKWHIYRTPNGTALITRQKYPYYTSLTFSLSIGLGFRQKKLNSIKLASNKIIICLQNLTISVYLANLFFANLFYYVAYFCYYS